MYNCLTARILLLDSVIAHSHQVEEALTHFQNEENRRDARRCYWTAIQNGYGVRDAERCKFGKRICGGACPFAFKIDAQLRTRKPVEHIRH